jgi:hypothetical protein
LRAGSVTIGSISRPHGAHSRSGHQVARSRSNTPPQVIVSNTPAILVLIDAALRCPTSDQRFQRVVNTRALILRRPCELLYPTPGWLVGSLGPWTCRTSSR